MERWTKRLAANATLAAMPFLGTGAVAADPQRPPAIQIKPAKEDVPGPLALAPTGHLKDQEIIRAFRQMEWMYGEWWLDQYLQVPKGVRFGGRNYAGVFSVLTEKGDIEECCRPFDMWPEDARGIGKVVVTGGKEPGQRFYKFYAKGHDDVLLATAVSRELEDEIPGRIHTWRAMARFDKPGVRFSFEPHGPWHERRSARIEFIAAPDDFPSPCFRVYCCSKHTQRSDKWCNTCAQSVVEEAMRREKFAGPPEPAAGRDR